jgi:hypothetical protein
MEIWPVHLQPLNDELLSSWMIRLAHGNGYKAHDFYAHYFGRDTKFGIEILTVKLQIC